VTRVVKGAPADRAGIRRGDLLLRVNGQGAVEHGLAWMASRLEPGDTVRLAIRRDEHERELRAIAGQRPQGMPLVTVEPGEDPGAFAVFGPQPSRVFHTGHDSIIVCSGNVMGTIVARPDIHVRAVEARADSLRQEIARRVMEARVTVLDSAHADSVAGRYIVRVGPGGNAVVVTGNAPTSFVSPRDLGVGSRAVAGAEFAELNPDLARYFHGARQGLLVLRVAPGTPAARAGLRAGDVLTRAGDETLNTIGDLRRVVALGQRPLRIEIIRDGQQHVLSLPRN
jgi:S1-C subfamily serine protease